MHLIWSLALILTSTGKGLTFAEWWEHSYHRDDW